LTVILAKVRMADGQLPGAFFLLVNFLAKHAR
jgi:hypothetical protein